MLDDVAEVFADTDLGHAVNATTSGAATIPGIFSRDYYGSDSGANVQTESSTPMFRVASANASGITQGNTLTIDSVAFAVVEVMPDETTHTTEFRLQAS